MTNSSGLRGLEMKSDAVVVEKVEHQLDMLWIWLGMFTPAL